MTLFAPRGMERDPPRGVALTANDRFKARWRARLGRAMIAAGAIHVGLFAGLAHREWTKPSIGSSSGRSTLQVIRLGGEPSSPDPLSPAFVTVSEEPETSSRRADPDGETGRADDGGPTSSRLTLEDLRRGATLRATVVTHEPEPDDGDPIVVEKQAADDDGPRVGGDASLGAHDAAADSLGLYRLSSLRPELAFAAPGNWILVRNPSAVRRFLLKRFGQAGLDSTPRGWLSVAIWVDETGSVEWAEIDRSSGIPEMDATALELFREVVSFRPARERGVPVSIAAIFQLRYPW